MNMLLAMAAPDLRDGYRQRTSAINGSKHEVTRVMAALDRARGVERAWDKTSVAARNWVVRDVLMLLAPSQVVDAMTDWSFVDTNNLGEQLSKVRESVGMRTEAQAAEQVLVLLGRLVDKAKNETYASYEEFSDKQRDFDPAAHARDDDEALQRYELWLKNYRPYLVLDLRLDEEQPSNDTERELARRMGFFLAKNPDPQFASRYEDRLWAYVYQVQSGLRRADDGV